MADYGLLPEGFVKMRLPEIRQNIINALNENLKSKGITESVEVRPDSIMGLTIDTFAEREAALWEEMQMVYSSMYPSTAEGVWLDYAVSFMGMTRITKSKSRGYLALYGSIGTSVPRLSQFKNGLTNTMWQSVEAGLISPRACADVSISPVVADDFEYVVTIDDKEHSYTSPKFSSLDLVLRGLVSALSTNQDLDVSSNGAIVRAVLKTKVSMSVDVGQNLSLLNIGSQVLIESLDHGRVEAGRGDINGIISLTNGLTKVSNLTAVSTGRAAESDDELRNRFFAGRSVIGRAVLPSFAPNLLSNVHGVESAKVFHNVESEVVDGRLPHSVHVIIEGGLDQEIAEEIYRITAGGIDTNGQIEKVVDLGDGRERIRFDRPRYIYVWAKVKLEIQQEDEELFPPDGFSAVKNDFNDIGQRLGLGADVIGQRFYCGIYKTDGIASANIRFAYSEDPLFVPGDSDYIHESIDVPETSRALFDLSRIEVT